MEEVLYALGKNSPRIDKVADESVNKLVAKYKSEYISAVKRDKIMQHFVDSKDDDSFSIQGFTGEELAEFWKSIDATENMESTKQEFLAKLKPGELPQPTNDRALEKVQSLSIAWFNKQLARMINRYVDRVIVPKKILPVQTDNYKLCKAGKLSFIDYENGARSSLVSEKLPKRVAELLVNPLLAEEREEEPGFEIEKAAWEEVRDWTNGLAKAVIEFYTDNKEIYLGDNPSTKSGRITEDVCKDYVRTLGGMRKLTKHVLPNLMDIMNDTKHKNEYASLAVTDNDVFELTKKIENSINEKENEYGKSDFTK